MRATPREGARDVTHKRQGHSLFYSERVDHYYTPDKNRNWHRDEIEEIIQIVEQNRYEHVGLESGARNARILSSQLAYQNRLVAVVSPSHRDRGSWSDSPVEKEVGGVKTSSLSWIACRLSHCWCLCQRGLLYPLTLHAYLNSVQVPTIQ